MKQKVVECIGQMKLFEMEFPVPAIKATAGTVREMVLSSPEEYLQRGERLISLAKQQLQKEMHRKLSDAETVLYNMNMDVESPSPSECLKKLRNIVGNYLRNIQNDGDTACEAIEKLTGGRVKVRLRVDLDTLKVHLGGDPDDNVIEVEVAKKDGSSLRFFSLKNRPFGLSKKDPTAIYDREFLVQDARNVISYIIMYSEVEKAFYDEEISEMLCSEVERKFHDVKKELLMLSELLTKAYYDVYLKSILSEVLTGNRSQFYNEMYKVIFRYLNSNYEIRAVMPKTEPVSDKIVSKLSEYGVTVMVSDKSWQELVDESISAVQKHFNSALPRDEKGAEKMLELIEIPISSHNISSTYALSFWDSDFVKGRLPDFEETFLTKTRFGKKGKEWEYFHCINGRLGQRLWDEWLYQVFYILYAYQHDMVVQWKDYQESVSDYAKSYQNKANLPQKTQIAMQESLLNDYFGYVEYDEDVDLVKVAEVEKMFLAVKETYFKKFDASRNAIRFRKLGNHNAIGLYYPGVKCLCVDYRYPHSFIHEFGHLIDYESGELSLKNEFYQIKCLYRERLMPNKSCFKAKTKYNLNYYLKPTEIFARSFEIYCRKVLKLDNDLLPEELSEAVYPTDTEFINGVTAYFDALLGR